MKIRYIVEKCTGVKKIEKGNEKWGGWGTALKFIRAGKKVLTEKDEF